MSECDEGSPRWNSVPGARQCLLFALILIAALWSAVRRLMQLVPVPKRPKPQEGIIKQAALAFSPSFAPRGPNAGSYRAYPNCVGGNAVACLSERARYHLLWVILRQ